MSAGGGRVEVVVDASLVGMWALREPHSQYALALATAWARAGIQAIAPYFMLAEVTSAIYKRVRRRELSFAEAEEALNVVLGFGVGLVEEPGLHQEALALAHRYNRPSPYDAHYLALAEMRSCAVWTDDERLYNAVHSQLPRLRWVGSPNAATR